MKLHKHSGFSVLSKFLVITLITSSLISPLTRVSAQEATPPSDAQSVDTSIPVAQDTTITNTEASAQDQPTIEAQVGSLDPIIQPSTILDPGVDAQSEVIVPGKVALPGMESLSLVNPGDPPRPAIESSLANTIPKPDLSTGALLYSYPITVPKGVNGLKPDLSLNYNSQKIDNASIVGFGWELSIPYIVRKNTHGVDQLYTRSDYASSEAGDLVLSNTNGSVLTFLPKVQDSSFSKYILDASTNIWKLTNKAGVTFEFGATSASREDDPSDATHIYKWMLSSITDADGNTIAYTYTKDQNKLYPLNINYGIFDIAFTLESRTDTMVSYAQGFLATTTSRVKTITVKESNTSKRVFTATYGAGDNASRSVIESIQETAYGAQGTTVLPSTTFEYSKNANPSWGAASSLTLPSTTDLNNGKSISIDFNGDGYADILTAYDYTPSNGTAFKKAYKNNGDGTWTISDAYEPPSYFVVSNNGAPSSYYGYRVFDINNDGLSDLVRTGVTYLNTGSGWQASTSTAPVELSYNGNNISTIADFNGDGLVDIHVSNFPGYSIQGGTYLNNGDGTWANVTSQWSFPVSSDNNKALFVDLNGDGITDIVSDGWYYTGDACGCTTYVSQNVAYLGNGKGSYIVAPNFVSPHSYSFFPVNQPSPGYDWGNRGFDMNNDNLPDLLYSTGYGTANATHGASTYINGVNGWSQDLTAWRLPSPIEFSSGGGFTAGGTLDLDGDGIAEIYHGNDIYKNQSSVTADLLSTVTFPTGGKIDVTYKSSAQYKDANNNLLNPNLPFTVKTVSGITTTDNVNGVTSTTQYNYSRGSYYTDPVNVFDRKFAGFNKVVETDPAGNITTTLYHQGNVSDSSNGEYNDDQWKIGKPYLVEMANSSGNIYNKTINKWDDADLGNGSKFVKLASTTVLRYDGGSSHTDTAADYIYDDGDGTLLTQTEWGQVTATTSGAFTDTGSDKRITNYEYVSNSTSGVFAPKHVTVTDYSSAKVAESKYYYDTLSYGSVDKGNQTKEEKWVNGSTYINTQKTYNSYGSVTSDIDPRGKTTSYGYDTYHLYPVTITDPLNHAVNFTYNYTLGKATTKTDPNNHTWTTTYDGFGRPVEEKIPDPAGGSGQVTKTAYVYTDTAGAVSVKTTNYLDSTIGVDSYNYTDGLGRPIQERAMTETAGLYTVKDYGYNNIGKLQKQSLPYWSVGASRTSATTTSALYSNFTYDQLGRLLADQNNAGTTSYVYAGLRTDITDPRGKAKSYYKDAYDNLVRVDENNASSTYTTTYVWDLNGRLINITDALGNVRNFTYDGLGQRLTAEDLHASSDNTFGLWSYSYDDAGNMIQSVSPEARTVNYTYDDTSRKITEDYAGATSTEITYAYDSCTNGIGRLCSIVMISGADTTYAYDGNGNIASEAKTINGTVYTTTYTYGRQGNQLAITYPDNAQVRYTFNAAGLLNQVERKESGGSFVNVIVNIDYAPTNQITYIAYGNGETTTNTYDATQLYRLTNKNTPNVASQNNRPVITLNGSNLILKNVGDTWIEPGYIATDTEDGTITASTTIIGTVNITAEGVYQLIYNVVDSRGMPAAGKIRTVVVYPAATSSNNPVITLSGSSLMNINIGDAWIEPGYTATDTEDGNITASVIITGSVNTAATGTYQLIYNVVDSQGVPAAGVIRTVVVHSTTSLLVKALVVAGGGSGWPSYGGAGGAGGLLYDSAHGVTVRSYTITVGNGGTTNPSSSNGQNSGFDTMTAIGGGHGGGDTGGNGQSGQGGGSGGGGRGISQQSKGGGTVGQGNDGSDGISNIPGSGGGSAGAAAGGSSSSGGPGILNPITGSGYLAAGGNGNRGGGGDVNTSGRTLCGIDGTANTGSGGGGGWNGSTDVVRAGGSGVVIIAYKSDGSDGVSASSTGGTITTSGGYRIHTFTTNGTFTVNQLASTNNNPVITLSSSTLMNISVGDAWVEPGYTATDVEDGTITASTTITGSINTAVVGTYQLIYNVTDSQGKPAAGKIRTVVVHPVVNIPLVAKVLVVGGGGGGGTWQNNGGGGGQVVYNAALTLVPSNYSVTVGSGGGQSDQDGTAGTASIFSTITANPGQGGVRPNGGASGSGHPSGAGNGFYSGGGGGGDSQNGYDGQNWSQGMGGAGGAGTSNSMTGTSIVYGGGGGGGSNAATAAAGGSGGGGNGGCWNNGYTPGSAGAANTGGGGGGGSYMAVGGGGGTGIVRVAYATGALIGTGGIVTTSGSNTIHTFTTSGTFTVSQPTSTNSNPVITLNGSELIDKNVGDTWTEPGYSATDAEDGNLTASVTATGSVNTAVAGIYQLVYDVMDLQGAHAARVTRTVVVNSVNNYLQNSTYAYDANGNITQIVDASGTHGAKTANYTYDDLNRLIEASITNVPTGQTAYDQTYAYNAIGNITNKSDIGDYIYTGSSGTNYANPHAATTINGATNTYDKDGNLLTDGTLVNTWDYRDQLIQTVTGSTTSAYWYDHMGQRVKQSVIATTTTTTYYPNRLYNISGSTSTKNIFLLDGTLITTVTGTGTSTAISYIHTDHLGSISVATDQDGNIKDFTDYYPYGSSRLDEKSGADISRKYIGQEFDGVTALSYLNARYYDGRRGQFVSQDPVFWENSLNQNLKNPQSLNSYSYAENNPIVKSDPSGKCVGPLVAVCIGGGVGAAGGIISQALSDYSTGEFGQRTWQENMETYGVAVVSGATVGAGTAAAILAAPVGIAGTMLVSGTAGTLTAGTTYLGNRVLGQSTDLANLVVGSGMSALTAGTLKNFPQVSGRNPNFNTRAFYTGAHAQRQAAEELFSNGVNMFGQAVNRFVSSQNYSTGSSIGGASLSSLAQQLQSLVGSLNSLVSSLSNSR